MIYFPYVGFNYQFLTDLQGASAFIGLGVYSYFSGSYQLRQQEAAILKSSSIFGMRSRRLGISGIASMLVGAGIWRLIS